jgi:hypothetical protein
MRPSLAERHAALHTSAIRKSGAISVTPSYKMATALLALGNRPATGTSPIVKAPKGRRDEFFESYFWERERVYAPLSAARLHMARGDASFPPHKHTLLDRLYRRPNTALDRLLGAVALPLLRASTRTKSSLMPP